jgi:hopanoid C-2 methylase
MRCRIPVTSERRVLCVFPAYSPSFGTFSHAYALMGRVRAFMPPQGLLVVAAWLPERWSVRFVDENMRRTRASEFAWADVVFVSGMHIQADRIRDIQRRAKAAGAVTVLGGPSASAAPESYPEFDYLHIGELDDATDRLVSLLDDGVEPPHQQIRLTTGERLALGDFPVPACHLVPLDRYFLASVQFSSGCPYRCEFCDIPTLYGRQSRLKSPRQVLGELDDVMRRRGAPSSVYCVDDNFIANRKAAAELLPHLVRWQQQHGYRCSSPARRPSTSPSRRASWS